MTALHFLAMRAQTAGERLAALQKRADRNGGTSDAVVRSAMKELAAAVEDLRAATEQMQRQAEELEDLRGRTAAMAERFDEFAELLPVACLWTSASGEIDSANRAAADFLNVSRPHLAGRALMLFVSERQKFIDAQAALATLVESVALVSVVRPRERRPRTVRLVGHRVKNDTRTLWFLLDGAQD